jgi:hypothetical protein
MAADETMNPAPETAAPAPLSALDSVRRTLEDVRHAFAGSGPFGDEIASVARGEDFDLSGLRNEQVLDALESTGIMLGQKLAAHGAASNDDVIERLKSALVGAMAEDNRAALGLRALSRLVASGASTLEPNAMRRIQERMRHLGDALARQVDERVAVATTREDRTQLKDLRDDLKDWRDSCDARVHAAQPLIDELTIRTRALRNEALLQADRLARAADLIERGAKDQTGRLDAASFARAVRDFLLRARVDMTASLQS